MWIKLIMVLYQMQRLPVLLEANNEACKFSSTY
jgi:hypothetical protein